MEEGLSVQEELRLYIAYQKTKRPIERKIRSDDQIKDISYWVRRKCRDLMDCNRILAWNTQIDYTPSTDKFYVLVHFKGEDSYTRVCA